MPNSTHLVLALVLAAQAPSVSTSTATPPRERAFLLGVVGRDASMPNGCLLRVDLERLVVEDLGAIEGEKELSFPSDGAPDPDGKHFWVAQTRFGGKPEAWRTWMQRIDLATRKQDRWIAVPGEVYLDAVAFDAAGRMLAVEHSCIPNRLVRVDLATGALTRLGDVDDGAVRGLAFHGDELWAVFEKRVAAPGRVEELLKLSPADGHVLARKPLALAADEHAVALAFTPRGRGIVAIQGSKANRLCEVELATGALTLVATPFLVPHGMQAAVR